MNISIYSPLSQSTYIKLPRELKKTMKGLINIKNNDNKCFRWYHIRNFNNLDYKGIEFPVPKKDFSQIEKTNNIFLDSTKLKIDWSKRTTFFKRHISIIL